MTYTHSSRLRSSLHRWPASGRRPPARPATSIASVDFADVTYADFVLSAAAAAPEIGRAARAAAWRTILAAIRATRAVVRTNTNLGIVLLARPAGEGRRRH